jgi:hypothetical protein
MNTAYKVSIFCKKYLVLGAEERKKRGFFLFLRYF